MKPIDSVINKIKWDKRENIKDYNVGYYDRIKNEILEMPLSVFLDSEIPYHRVRYLKKKGNIVWDRRK